MEITTGIVMGIFTVWTMDTHSNAMTAPCFVSYPHKQRLTVLAGMVENRGAPSTTPQVMYMPRNGPYHRPRARCY